MVLPSPSGSIKERRLKPNTQGSDKSRIRTVSYTHLVKKGDVVIAISNSGETMELEATVQTLIANGAHIISCTGNPQSTLAKQSEVCLVAHVDEEGDELNKPCLLYTSRCV